MIHLNENRSHNSKHDNNYNTMQRTPCMHSRFEFASTIRFKYFIIESIFPSVVLILEEKKNKKNKKVAYIVQSKILLFWNITDKNWQSLEEKIFLRESSFKFHIRCDRVERVSSHAASSLEEKAGFSRDDDSRTP